MQEIHHRLNDLAVQSGRKLQSKQTRLIHHFYGKREQPIDQTIPFYENLLFAQALCKMRTVDAIQEAKALLLHLLAYQHPNGLFPVYLHEYPYCHDLFCGARLLPVFFRLEEYFQTYLGVNLAGPMQRLAEKTRDELPKMPSALRAEAEGALIAMGLLPQSAFQQPIPSGSPEDLAEWLTGAHLAGVDLPSALPYNSKSYCFTGSWRDVAFERGTPQIGLLDLYAAASLREIPSHWPSHHPAFLKSALLFPERQAGFLCSSASFEVGTEPSDGNGYQRGNYPFYIFWGSKRRALTLHPGSLKAVTAQGNIIAMALGNEEGDIELTYDAFPGAIFKVNGLTATVFRSGDLLTIEDGEGVLTLRFEVMGEGRFLGHLSKGNRPTEWVNAGEDRFTAYCNLLTFRNLERKEDCLVKLHWSFT